MVFTTILPQSNGEPSHVPFWLQVKLACPDAGLEPEAQPSDTEVPAMKGSLAATANSAGAVGVKAGHVRAAKYSS